MEMRTRESLSSLAAQKHVPTDIFGSRIGTAFHRMRRFTRAVTRRLRYYWPSIVRQCDVSLLLHFRPGRTHRAGWEPCCIRCDDPPPPATDAASRTLRIPLLGCAHICGNQIQWYHSAITAARR